MDLPSSIQFDVSPAALYNLFIETIKTNLLEAGAFVSQSGPIRPHSKPLWWNERCDKLLAEKRENYRWYECEQSNLNRIKFKRTDAFIKRSLREQKILAFREFCQGISPKGGMSTLLRTLKALTSLSVRVNTNISTDSNTPEMQKFRDDLIMEDIPPVQIPILKTPLLLNDPNFPLFSENENRRVPDSTVFPVYQLSN